MTTSRNNDLAREWPEPRQFGRSIRFEFSLYMSAILLTLMLVTGYVVTTQYVNMVTQSITEKLLVQARSYSSPAGKLIISSDEPDALLLGNICKKLTEDNPEVYWAGIAGKDNVYLAHTDLRQVIASNRMSPAGSGQSGSDLREGETFNLHNDTIYITVPIRENDLVLGKLRMASSVEPINSARRTSVMSVASITVIVLLFGLPVTMIVLRRKLRPITMITDSLKSVNFEDFALNIPVSSKNEFGYLAESLQVMGAKLNAAQRHLIEKERIAREMEIAREIQANILPRDYPKTSHFEFAGAYQSALEVGGDYYDFIDIDKDHLGFLIADVSGKSLPGMLVMLLTRDIVIRLARTYRDPAELLTEANSELLLSVRKGMFVTMFFGVLNKKSGCLTFASAGHNPVIKIDGITGKAELFKTKGYPLAMLPRGPFSERIESSRITLSENDWLIQYTDGINEAQNSAGEEYGMDRFLDALKPCCFMSPRELTNQTLRQLESFVGSQPQYDDITLLAIKWTGETVNEKNAVSDKATSTG